MVFVGLLAIKQIWFFGDYCIGMENGLAFWGLLIVYIILISIETHLNLSEKKWRKRVFDKSALYITIVLVVLFMITQSVDLFKSEINLTAKTDKGFGHELVLRNNGDFDLTRHYIKKDCHYFGKYKWNNDTLEVDGKGEIDARYYWNNTKQKLISKSGHFDDFNVKKTGP